MQGGETGRIFYAYRVENSPCSFGVMRRVLIAGGKVNHLRPVNLVACACGLISYNKPMETVHNIYKEARAKGIQPVSFEIFPPKGDLTLDVAHKMAEQLTDLNPDFISVTYSAGGSGNKQATADIASMIQGDFDVPTVAHLTCAGATEEFIGRASDDLKDKGITNVLALRGDLTHGCKPSVFRNSSDLIRFLVEEDFCVGAAAYPEGHLDCFCSRTNIEHLKYKQDAGASFFVTQLFFSNSYFYRFREAAYAAGVRVPIACGIMPFLSKDQLQRMVFMCGASLPASLIKLIARYEHSPEDLRHAGIEYACAQLEDLAAEGVDGLHVYTMNQPDIAYAAMRSLRMAWRS